MIFTESFPKLGHQHLSQSQLSKNEILDRFS